MFTVRKIAIVSSFFPPSDKVGAEYSYYLAKELALLGIDVRVITTWGNEETSSKKMDGFSVTSYPIKKVLNRFYSIESKHYKMILSEVEEFNPDCIVTNDYYRRLSFFGAKASRALNIPCISVNHLLKPLKDKNPILNYFLKRYETRMLHLNKKYRVVFAGASTAQNEHLKKMNAVSRYEIPYGINTDVSPLPTAKRKLGISDDTMLFVLNIGEAKQVVNKAIEALEVINKYKGPNAVLAIIGKKPKHIKDGYPDVVFTGEISKEEDLAIKYACDIYLCFLTATSSYQNLMEAGLLSCATICVLMDKDMKFSFIENLVSGKIIEDDAKMLSDAMQKLRLHSKVRSKYAQNLNTSIEQKHNWSQSALALIDAVWELNGGRRRG